MRVSRRSTGVLEPQGRTRTVTVVPVPPASASSRRRADQPAVFLTVDAQDDVAGRKGAPSTAEAGPVGQADIHLSAGHLALVLAVALPGKQLGVGVVQGSNQGLGRGLVEVALAYGIDVVAVDGADDVFEEAGLLVDGTLRRCFSAKQPSSSQNGECEDRYEPTPAGLSGGSFHAD